MAIWYRAANTSEIKKVFSGEGGLFTPARWNHLGRKAIYCSESISLCTLEWLSHNGLSVSGFNYYRFSIEVPDHLVKKFLPENLPAEWNNTPATDTTRDLAEEHLFLAEQVLALALPSVLVPEEFNLIINPLHNDFSTILKNCKMLGKHTTPLRN